MTDTKSEPGKDSKPPIWEWFLAGVGLLLIVGVVAAMTYRGVTSEDSPPGFEIAIVSVAPSVDGFVATFRVKNLGYQTAASLGLEGTLERAGQKVESATANLTYVPGNSEREGGLFFKNDPSQFKLQLRATGYEKP